MNFKKSCFLALGICLGLGSVAPGSRPRSHSCPPEMPSSVNVEPVRVIGAAERIEVTEEDRVRLIRALGDGLDRYRVIVFPVQPPSDTTCCDVLGTSCLLATACAIM